MIFSIFFSIILVEKNLNLGKIFKSFFFNSIQVSIFYSLKSNKRFVMKKDSFNLENFCIRIKIEFLKYF